MDIAETHKESKPVAYWNDLDQGSTTQYKGRVLENLIKTHFPPTCDSIIDIGSGTNCEHILKYKEMLQAKKLACFDYDKNVIENMKEKYSGHGIEWHVADVFALDHWKNQFDLVFLLDVVHEIYSFYGRPNRDMNEPVNHDRGQEFVRKAIGSIAANIRPTGIVITDNIICEDNGLVTMRCRTAKSRRAVEHFLDNYPTVRFTYTLEGDVLEIGRQHLCTLLTQYNKIKNGDTARWNVERLERHQYMTFSEYRSLFGTLGYNVFATIETPQYVLEEWNADFEVLAGPSFPEKRVTLLALKNGTKK